MPPKTVFIVDDNPLVINAMTRYIDQAPDLHVVGSASDGAEALGWLNTHHCDLVLSDLAMATMDGIELCQHVRRLPDPPIFLAMTAFDSDATMRDCLSAGAAGYILKVERPQTIIAAIREALRGGAHLSYESLQRLVGMTTPPAVPYPDHFPPPQRQPANRC